MYVLSALKILVYLLFPLDGALLLGNIQESKIRKQALCFVYVLSCVQLFATPRTVGCQALLSMGFSRQEYWSGLPFPTPEDLDPGIKPRSPASPVSSMFLRAVWMKGLKIRVQGVLRPRICPPTFLVHPLVDTGRIALLPPERP